MNEHVGVMVSVKLDLEEVYEKFSPEQTEALFHGIAQILNADKSAIIPPSATDLQLCAVKSTDT